MQIETKRLLIRDIKTDDAVLFAIMAADGTLNDCGFVMQKESSQP